MCDYSLMGVSNRLARCGEDLVTHRFHTGTMGLTSSSDLRPATVPQPRTFWATVKGLFAGPKTKPFCAVCVPPGTQLLWQEIPQSLQRELNVDSTEHVTFTQVSAETNRYRDAVMLANGRTLLLQRLHEGQRMRVLSLSSDDRVTSFRERFEEVSLR